VDQHPAFGLSSPDGHIERLQHHIRGLAALHRPAHDTTRIEVEHDCKVGKSFQGADVDDVCDPYPVGRLDIKLPDQRVVDYEGWPATMAIWSPPVMQPCLPAVPRARTETNRRMSGSSCAPTGRPPPSSACRLK